MVAVTTCVITTEWTVSSSSGQHLRRASHCWTFRQLQRLTKHTYMFLCICLHPVCIFRPPDTGPPALSCAPELQFCLFLASCYFGVLVHIIDQMTEFCFLILHTVRFYTAGYTFRGISDSAVNTQEPLSKSASWVQPCLVHSPALFRLLFILLLIRMLEPQGTAAKSCALPGRPTGARDRKTLGKFM